MYDYLGGKSMTDAEQREAARQFVNRWMGSWGKIDAYLKAGAQWNRVPYPLLIMPAANLSYIVEDETFNLINNMEFLNVLI